MITANAARMLRKAYVQIRNEDSSGGSNYRITVRQLESLVRLSEALARVNLSLEVDESHVAEATRLLSCSILKVHKADLTVDGQEDLVEDLTDVRDSSKNNAMVSLPYDRALKVLKRSSLYRPKTMTGSL
jgi:DNA replication licensing factor MCM6